MDQLNSIIIEGNLTKDPVSKSTPAGAQVCNFSIATNRSYKVGESYEKEVSFVDVEAWSKLGQTCSSNLQKGRGVRVVGRLKQDRWTDTNGQNHQKMKVVAEHVDFKPAAKKEGGEIAENRAASVF